MLTALEAQIDELERYANSHSPTGPTRYSRLASAGLTELARARHRWLRAVWQELFGA